MSLSSGDHSGVRSFEPPFVNSTWSEPSALAIRIPSFAAHAIWVLSRDQANWTSLPGALTRGAILLPSAEATTMSAWPETTFVKAMKPVGPGGTVGDGEADSDGATAAGALAAGVGAVAGGGDHWGAGGPGVALPPPRMPPANRIARMATSATAS